MHQLPASSEPPNSQTMSVVQSEFKLPLVVKKASRDSTAKKDDALATLSSKLGGEWKLDVDIAKDVAAIHDFFKEGGRLAF